MTPRQRCNTFMNSAITKAGRGVCNHSDPALTLCEGISIAMAESSIAQALLPGKLCIAFAADSLGSEGHS